jgi:predicted Zn-dependent protease
MRLLQPLYLTLILFASIANGAEQHPSWDKTKPVPVLIEGVRQSGKEAKMVRESVRVALALWSQQTGLTFQIQTTLPPRDTTSDLREYGIRVVYDKKMDAAPVELAGITHVSGEDTTIKYAIVQINATTRKWPDPEVALYTLVLHELGHAIGIGHLNSGVMYWAANGLQPPDIKAARELYGMPVATVVEGKEEECEH